MFDDGFFYIVINMWEGDYIVLVSFLGGVNGLIVGVIENGWGVVV